MPAKHLLSISGLTGEIILALVERAVALASGRGQGERPLPGRIVGLYFRKTSTRTRTSFTVGAMKLGAQVVAYTCLGNPKGILYLSFRYLLSQG